MATTLKACSNCSRTKELKEFQPDPRMVDGYQDKCKECIRQETLSAFVSKLGGK